MKEPVITHNTISDFYRSINLPCDQELDFSIHSLADIHKSFPFRSPVFRTNYYSFVFIKDGYGSYTTDNLTFNTQPGTIYFTNPGHLKAFTMRQLTEAYIITFTEAFLKENIHPNIFAEFPFLLAETVPPSDLSENDFAPFENLYLQVFSEFHSESPYKYRIIGNLFVVILLKIKQLVWSDYNPIAEGDRGSLIVKRFKEHLEKHYRRLDEHTESYLFQVQDYAR